MAPQPSTPVQVPQRAAFALSRGPGDPNSSHPLALHNRITRQDQSGPSHHNGRPSEPQAPPEVAPIEHRPERLGSPSPHMSSPSHIPLQSHSSYGSFDTEIDDTLSAQTRIPRVRIDPSERPVERMPRDVVPVPASSVMRYSRNIRIRSSRSRYVIQPGTKKFSDSSLCPPGWEASTHPEGALYFYNAERRIFTDANLYKHKYDDVITKCADNIFQIAEAQGIDLSEDTELVLEIMDERSSRLRRCGYYFVDPSNRSMFWVHPFQAEEIFENIKGVKSLGHIKYAIESQYWMHCELFPNHRRIEESLILELREIIMHATSDSITSDTSLTPFGRGDMSKILEIVDHIQGSIDKTYPHSICILARFMCTFSRTKFFNFYGQVGARLAADQTIYYRDRSRRSILLSISAPLFFGVPRIYAQGLKAICMDQLVNHIPWKPFIEKLNSEWETFTLYSLIILNANIVFLSISDLSLAARISSYVSTISSVGAIIVGLLLMRQYRTHTGDSPNGAVIFVARMSRSISGTEAMAIIYSIPYAFFLWSMIFFVLAFTFLVFQYSDHITRILVGSVVGLVTFFVAWTIWMAWDIRIVWWLHSTGRKMRRVLRRWVIYNRLFGKNPRQRFLLEDEGELMMPPMNDAEIVATDSDLED